MTEEKKKITLNPIIDESEYMDYIRKQPKPAVAIRQAVDIACLYAESQNLTLEEARFELLIAKKRSKQATQQVVEPVVEKSENDKFTL